MWLEHLKIAGRALRAHKFRSLLTVLSITVGAFSIVLMSSLAESGLASLAKGIEDLGGARLIFISPKKPERQEDKQSLYTRGITVRDRDALFDALPNIDAHAQFLPIGRRDVLSEVGRFGRADVVGGDAGFLPVFNMKIAKGRAFSEEENRRHAKVCIVGHKTAEKLWDEDALGHTLSVAGVRCRVIGQLVNEERWGINFGFDWQELIILPVEMLGGEIPEVAQNADLLVRTRTASDNDITKRIANAIMEERHHGVDDFEIFDFAKIMDQFHKTFLIMKIIVGFLAGIALLVGGIGVMNMMLVSVSERVREIGIRKALGASPRDIASQFLLEAMVLSGAGGALGVVGGVGISIVTGIVLHHFKPNWVPALAYGAIFTASVVSIAIGIGFGFFPARRAAKLDAVEAMRK